MNNAWAQYLCRVLAALMIWTPCQMASAGMIGTERAAAPSAQAERATLLAFVSRDDAQRQMQAMGVDAAAAKDRVAAMSDEEVRSLAGRIGSAPAGAMADGAAILLIVVVVMAIWWFTRR